MEQYTTGTTTRVSKEDVITPPIQSADASPAERLETLAWMDILRDHSRHDPFQGDFHCLVFLSVESAPVFELSPCRRICIWDAI